MLATIGWLREHGALDTAAEADELLVAAGMAPLNDAVPAEQALHRQLTQMDTRQGSPPTVMVQSQHLARAPQLPVAAGPLIGRRQELMGIVQCLLGPACRLLNLVGPGGIGKTRLAIEAAHAVEDHFAQGVYWINLQPIQDPAGLAIAIADALALPLNGRDTEAAQLVHYLRNKQLLLILDNFEHLAPAADLLVAIVAETPRVTLLATSREAIHVQAEWLYPVGSLPFPPDSVEAKGDPAWEDIAGFAAVQLFVTRARQLQPTFAPAAQCSPIVRICRLTGGMPLALVLAASWIPSLTCTEIAGELAADLALLSTSLRDMPERHRTIHAVFEQSWQRLRQEEQAVFQRLVVFRGGFRREAAQQMAGATLHLLATLVNHSFLMPGEDGRYQIHELLRQLGEAKLAANAGELAQVRARHCAYYAELMGALAPQMLVGDDLGAVGQLVPEMDNIRAAWHWAIERRDAGALRSSAATLHWIWQAKCRFQEGFQLLNAGAAALPADEGDEIVVGARIECYLYAGWLALRLGRIEEATCMASQSLLLQRTHGIAPLPGGGNTAAGVLSLLAVVRGDQTGAEQLANEAYEAAKLSGNIGSMNTSRYALAQAYLAQGKLAAAAEACGEAATISQREGYIWFLAYCLITQGEIALAQGRLNAARRHFADALAIRQKFGDSEGIALAHYHLGDVALREDQPDAAAAHFQASRVYYADTNDLGGLATAEQGLGLAAVGRGELETAARHYRQALQLAAASSYVPRIMSLLNHTSELLLYRGDREKANQLLEYVLGTESSSQGIKEETRRLLALAAPIEMNERTKLLTMDDALALAEAALCHTWS